MSFFYDCLKNFDLDELGEKIYVSLIVDVGVVVVGDLKIDEFSENEIVLKNKHNVIVVSGENIKIKSLAKGEFVIQGKIQNIKSGVK